MKGRTVVHSANLPMHPPLLTTIVFFLLLDRIGAPEWLYGVIGVLFALLWLLWFCDVWASKTVRILKGDDSDKRAD